MKNIYIMPCLQETSPSAATTASQLECLSSAALRIPACPQQQPSMQVLPTHKAGWQAVSPELKRDPWNTVRAFGCPLEPPSELDLSLRSHLKLLWAPQSWRSGHVFCRAPAREANADSFVILNAAARATSANKAANLQLPMSRKPRQGPWLSRGILQSVELEH